MDNSSLETVQKDIDEIEQFILQSKRPNILRILKEQLILLQSTLKSEKDKAEKEKISKETVNVSNISSNNKSYVSLTKYAFENSEKFAKVYFTDNFANLKSHPAEKIKSSFSATSFEICVEDWNGKNLRFACTNLNKKISASDSYVKATGSGLTVYLKKDKPEFWDGLEKKKSLIGDPDAPKEGLGADKGDPSAGLMNMMKEMYQNGDENTKRMIAESWMKAQEGKGTGGMGGLGGMGGMGGMGGLGGMGGMGGLEGMMGGMGGLEGMMGGLGGKGGMGNMPNFDDSDM